LSGAIVAQKAGNARGGHPHAKALCVDKTNPCGLSGGVRRNVATARKRPRSARPLLVLALQLSLRPDIAMRQSRLDAFRRTPYNPP